MNDQKCRDALARAREDINWMLNNRQFLNSFVFNYIDEALSQPKHEPVGELPKVEHQETWPERIWIQQGEEPTQYSRSLLYSEEVTWCEDKIHECDIPYIRADLAKTQTRQALERAAEICEGHGICDAKYPAEQIRELMKEYE